MFRTPLTEPRRRLHWPLLIAIGGLMVIGVAFIYSARGSDDAGPWYSQYAFKQMVWYLMGMTAGVAVCLMDYHRLARWSLVAYWGTILLLVLVLIPHVGSMRMGARRWIDFGFFQLQPSEFAKLAFIFAQANFLSRPSDELQLSGIFWKSLSLTTLPFLLIMKEPDLGSALVFFPMGLAMMLVAGVPVKYLVRLLAGVFLLISLILIDVLFAPPHWQIKLQEYQRQRLLVYFGRDFARPDATPSEREAARKLQRAKSYNIEQALISVGSGGLTGKGWQQGTQSGLGYLPKAVAHNDFIFSVIAEEKGFLGSLLVIGLYVVVLFSGIKIADQARDRLGKTIAVGVVTLFFCHVFINIGMNIRLMPVTGIPLPLLSYGGSSVLCSLVAIGVLQNVYLYRRAY